MDVWMYEFKWYLPKQGKEEDKKEGDHAATV